MLMTINNIISDEKLINDGILFMRQMLKETKTIEEAICKIVKNITFI